jgi:hypothetical protein
MVGFSSSPIYRFCNRHCLGDSDFPYKVFNHLVDKMNAGTAVRPELNFVLNKT